MRDRCESGCGPAVTTDPQGVPLCQACADMLDAEGARLADEVVALRAQVAALKANGVSMHKAAAAERSAIVAWLRTMRPTERQCEAMTSELLADLADAIERGDHHGGGA